MIMEHVWLDHKERGFFFFFVYQREIKRIFYSFMHLFFYSFLFFFVFLIYFSKFFKSLLGEICMLLFSFFHYKIFCRLEIFFSVFLFKPIFNHFDCIEKLFLYYLTLSFDLHYFLKKEKQ